MRYVIRSKNIFTEDGIINGYVVINNDKIEDIQHGDYTGELLLHDYMNAFVLPGFIDIHIHGGYGEDAMDASYKGLLHLSKSLLSEGTTSFLPTTMTQSNENIIQALANISRVYEEDYEGAEILGIHLEGPFISEEKIGAQNPEYVQKPDSSQLKTFQTHANNLIKIVTFAPEKEGAESLVESFPEIIFSIGHSAATYEQAEHAVKIGAKHITHLYNGSSGFMHREPGVVGMALTNEQIHTEMIVDGLHAHPSSAKLAITAKGNDKFYLITDAMRAKGKPDGVYDLGGQQVTVKDGVARIDTGSLAGSVLKMNQGLKNLIHFSGKDLEALWRVTSLNQAIALKVDDKKGSIKIGKDADIAILNNDFDVISTIKSGKRYEF
ncbi:N-acetylglucosamine-6-phosphate deacetylase [Macrococcoides bohemicum]|uniref:N-acetylglucosamine-6-phosphate deacetylase n=1 Tax=Macrococcoides bohemicum TaxID=1903056 RepID=UPI00193F6454|nr:N-acetylglucosamine-6-phosphate deacetylase [Macrococcus bohemicus]QRN48710.1 N-acetylglucosamine-6-phosphate deacetylase [Macrococcus bohemicus]QYA44859.1 N-acetylglucosamine-6-phosphate deacetylase [Macrococcus bohemicus]